MPDAATLAFDTAGILATVGLPGFLWLFLYLFAWEDRRRAVPAGFGRFTFWLLAAGSLSGWLANLPIFAWGNDILLVNVGGGLIPVALAAYLLIGALGKDGTPFLQYAALLGLETVVLLLLVLFVPAAATAGSALILAAFLVALAAPPLLLLLMAPPPGATHRAGTSAALLLTGVALLVTFLTTSANPAIGISSPFPLYLVAPALTGGLAVVAGVLLGLPRAGSLRIGYATTTLGVLVGADVLREPPLYGHGAPALFSIGGAGLFDLLYLSGPLALLVAWAVARLLPEGAPTAVPAAVPEYERVRPNAILSEAGLLLRNGEAAPSLRASALAVRTAADRTRSVMGLPGAEGAEERWHGLPAPPWIVADAANLEAAAGEGRPEEAPRALWTSRMLVGLLSAFGTQRFGTVGSRVLAYLFDLLVIGVLSGLGFAIFALVVGGGATALASNVAFNALILAYSGYGFLYFSFSEAFAGGTFGKRLLHLSVVDDRLGRPTLWQTVQRNLPKLLPLTLLTEGVAVAVLLLAAPVGPVGPGILPEVGIVTAIVELLGSIFGICLVGLVSYVMISSDGERRRLGDRWAGTLVLRGQPTHRGAPAAHPLPEPMQPSAPRSA